MLNSKFTNKYLQNTTITIYNYLDYSVKEILSFSGNKVTLNRDNLPSGLYFLRLTQDSEHIETIKLIITD